MAHWTPPIVLDPQVPRAVKLSRTYRYLILIVFLITTVILSFSAYLFGADAYRIHRLQERGIDTTGEITRTYKKAYKHGYTYHVDFDFRLPNPSDTSQNIVSSTDIVSEAEFPDYYAGEKVDILYDSVRPSRSALNTGNRVRARSPTTMVRTGGEFVLGIAILFYGTFGIVLVPTYFREKLLLRWGSLARATITGEQKYRTRSGPFSKVTYTFTDSAGRIVEGKRRGIPTQGDKRRRWAELRAKIVDNPTALFDPEDSSRNTLWPPTSVELRQ